MAEKEPSDEISASSTEPLRWPDPSRPIINERPSQGWGGYPRQPGYLPVPEPRREWSPRKRRRRRAIAATLVILVLTTILVAVWLLWWR